MGGKRLMRIVILARLQDAMHTMHQLAHEGNDDDRVGLATGLQFADPAHEIGIRAHHREGRHGEPLADLRMANFGNGGQSMHRGARVLLS